MNIDTLPAAEAHEIETIKQFDSFPEATAWIEKAAEKLGESTVSTYRKSLEATQVAEPQNVELARMFSQADTDVLFQRDYEEEIPKYTPSFERPPDGGWPLRESGSHVLLRVVDETGGEYNLSLDKKLSSESAFYTQINSSISYTTNGGTDLEHTTSVNVDTDSLQKQNKDGSELIAEYLEVAAGLRNVIMRKVEMLAPEKKTELEAGYQQMSFMKKAFGRLALGKSVNLVS